MRLLSALGVQLEEGLLLRRNERKRSGVRQDIENQIMFSDSRDGWREARAQMTMLIQSIVRHMILWYRLASL